MPKILQPRIPFVRENILGHVYRGDFYHEKVGHKYDDYTGDFFDEGEHEGMKIAFYHFGILKDFREGERGDRALLQITNEEGATLQFTGVKERHYKRMVERASANIGRPILVLMDTDTSKRPRIYDLKSDPKAITFKKDGSMTAEKMDSEAVFETKASEGVKTLSIKVDWTKVDEWLGPTRASEILEEAWNYFDDEGEPYDEGAVHKFSMEIDEEIRVAQQKFDQRRLQVTKQLVSRRKRNLAAHGQELKFRWEFIGTLECKVRTFSHADQMTLDVPPQMITIQPNSGGFVNELYVYHGEGAIPFEEMYEKLDQLEGKDCLACLTKDGQVFDVVAEENASDTLEMQLGEVNAKLQTVENTIEERTDHYSKRLTETRQHEKEVRAEHEKLKTDLRAEMSKLRNRQAKLAGELKRDLEPIMTNRQEIERASHELIKLKNQVPELKNQRTQEADKLIAFDEMRKRAIAERAIRDVTQTMEEQQELATVENLKLHNELIGQKIEQMSAFAKAHETLTGQVKEAKASAKVEVTGVATAMKLGETNVEAGESPEVRALKAELRAEKAEREADREREGRRADNAEAELRMFKLHTSQEAWRMTSEEEKSLLLDQLAHNDFEEWSEEEKKRFKGEANSLRGVLADMIGTQVPVKWPKHAMQQFALRYGVHHAPQKITIKLQEVGKKGNTYKVFLPEYSVEALFCLVKDRTDPQQMAVVTVKSVMSGWKKVEDETLGFMGKWDTTVSVEKRLSQHKEIQSKMLMASA